MPDLKALNKILQNFRKSSLSFTYIIREQGILQAKLSYHNSQPILPVTTQYCKPPTYTLGFLIYMSGSISLVSVMPNNETVISYLYVYIDGLVQKRRNSSALAMELRLSCTNPLIYISTDLCNSLITPVHQQWSCCSLLLNHHYIISYHIYFIFQHCFNTASNTFNSSSPCAAYISQWTGSA